MHSNRQRDNAYSSHGNIEHGSNGNSSGLNEEYDRRQSGYSRRHHHRNEHYNEHDTREYDPNNKRRKYDQHDDRSFDHNNRDNRYANNNSNHQESRWQQHGEERRTPTATLMLRGLSPETTERLILESFPGYWPSQVRLVTNRETGDPRGFAFADFNSVEDAMSVMNMYTFEEGGSQLIIDNRVILLEYGDSRSTRPTPSSRPIRTDWICDQCNTTNFARRTVCFRCNQPKGPGAMDVTGNIGGTDSEMSAESSVPSNVLVVRGLLPNTTEEDLREIFRAYAPVKEVRLVLNKTTNMSRGFSFIEFSSVEHATHTLNAAYGLTIGGMQVRMSYARETFHMKMNVARQPAPRPMNLPAEVVHQYAAAALEQAQWSLGNGYGYQQQQQVSQSSTAGTPQTNPVLVHRPLEPKREYPVPFEQGGLSFVYDSATGFYYDADSCFYYDSNAKLYYSRAKEKYYRHTPETEPPFTMFTPPVPDAVKPLQNETNTSSASSTITTTTTTNSTTTSTTSTTTSANTIKPTSTIVKKNGTFGAKSSTTAAKPIKISIATKRQAKEIAKWNQIQKDIAPVEENTNPVVEVEKKPTRVVTELPVPSNSIVSPQGDLKVTESSTARPVCLICRRQFNSLEVLKKHETMSKLHLENVAQLRAKADQVASAATPKYRDRAQERRNLHGQDAAPKLIESPHSREATLPPKPVSVPRASVVPTVPEKPLDSGNVGNKMLKLMGWKEGEGLGRRRHGITAPIIAKGRTDTSGLGCTGITSNIQPGDSYREIAQKMARARYESARET